MSEAMGQRQDTVLEASETVRIRNRLGLHARPAAEFVRLASRFDAQIWVEKENLEVNGKSIMGVMMLAAEAGSEILIRALGVDAPAAVESLSTLVNNGFDEELAAGFDPLPGSA